MHANAPSKSGKELPTFGPVIGSFKGTLDALFEAPESSDSSLSSDGLREAVHEMFHAISNLLNEELDSAQTCLQRAASALRLAPRSTEIGSIALKRSHPIIRGGLAPWQARLLKTHIETHLDTTIRTKELAKLVQLSSFHFCRVFRVSFGSSPHGYVTKRRIERAQGLILTRKLPLGQIAVDCGFADQAHFTKLFRRLTGESPGEWRRMRAEDDAGRAIVCELQGASLEVAISPIVSDATATLPPPYDMSIEITDACRRGRTTPYADSQNPFLCTPR